MIGSAPVLPGISRKFFLRPDVRLGIVDRSDMFSERRLREYLAAYPDPFDRRLQIIGFSKEVRIDDGRIARVDRPKPDRAPALGPGVI